MAVLQLATEERIQESHIVPRRLPWFDVDRSRRVSEAIPRGYWLQPAVSLLSRKPAEPVSYPTTSLSSLSSLIPRDLGILSTSTLRHHHPSKARQNLRLHKHPLRRTIRSLLSYLLDDSCATHKVQPSRPAATLITKTPDKLPS
jgi:hypothetical protein